MKNKMFAVAIFAASLGGGTTLIASSALAKAPAATVAAEKHPEVRKAIGQLKAAISTMDHAAWDFGGHKTDAINDTKNAIAELNKALKFDKH